jgi:hypothetical protein
MPTSCGTESAIRKLWRSTNGEPKAAKPGTPGGWASAGQEEAMCEDSLPAACLTCYEYLRGEVDCDGFPCERRDAELKEADAERTRDRKQGR